MSWIWAIRLVKRTLRWGKEAECQTMEKAEEWTFSASSIWPEGPQDEILLQTARSPTALTLPGVVWHDKRLYLIWEGIGCLLAIPPVPSGKRDWKSHCCLYGETHPVTPIPAIVWMGGRWEGPAGWAVPALSRGAGLRSVCGAFRSIKQIRFREIKADPSLPFLQHLHVK